VFYVCDASWQALGYFYFDEEPRWRAVNKRPRLPFATGAQFARDQSRLRAEGRPRSKSVSHVWDN
jgi:hypothetical protein